VLTVRGLSSLVLMTLIFANSISFGATQVVFGPKSYSPGFLKPSDQKDQFATSARKGTLKLVNGDGKNITYQTCSGTLAKKLLCEASNLLVKAQLLITRPTTLIVDVNDQSVATQTNLPLTLGQIEIPVTLTATTKVRVRLSGSPLATLKVQISASTETVNQLPIASMQLSHSQGFAPLTLTANGLASVDPDGSIVDFAWDFGDGGTASGAVASHIYTSAGNYSVRLTVKDNNGATNTQTKQLVVLQNQLPTVDLRLVSAGTGVAPLMVVFDGSRSADPEGGTLRYLWNFGDGTQIEGKSVETYQYLNPGTYQATLTVQDVNGGQAVASTSIVVNAVVLPPAPETVAPSLANNANPSFTDKISFLYTGENPIQKNVNVAAIDPKRLSLIRGRTLDGEGAELSGVKVKILNEGDFGETLSRTDGGFDLAFNSGDNITLEYSKNGYAPVQRKVAVKSQDYYSLDEVRLVKFDAKVTTIALGSAQAQVAKGSTQADDSGERTGMVVFPSQTQASIVLPDGSTKTVPNLNIRITEFTVGADGPKKMPASLPGQSAYTYAVEISADEAVALNAKTIKFNKPVAYYVNNFLNLPVGVAVPLGSYDASVGVWKPELDGIVLKILGRNAGIAQLDLGKGRPATAAELSQMGFFDDELRNLASNYADGNSLWRITTDHFTPLDLNYVSLPPDIKYDGDAENADPEKKIPETDCLGCTINVESKVLGEKLDVPGTDIKLSYTTDRVPGRKARSLVDITLTGNNPPQELKRIDVKIGIAGKVTDLTFSPAANLRLSVSWDGTDAFGRFIPNGATAKVRIRYVMDEKYQVGTYQPNTSTFGGLVVGAVATEVPGRSEVNFDKEFAIPVSANQQFESSANGKVASGWFVDKHHIFDPDRNAIFFGDGRNLFLASLPYIYKNLTVGGSAGFSGDGGLARFAKLNSPSGAVEAADGSIYIADRGNNRIRKIGVDGVINTVAGDGNKGYNGDGGLAINSSLNLPHSVKVERNGTMYISDTGNHCIRRVDPQGYISTFAGVCGQAGFTSGDKATALLNSPKDIVFNGDGSFYVSDTGNHAIRRISASGNLTTVAGTGLAGFTNDDTPASTSSFSSPRVTDVDSFGNLLIADTGNNRVRRISTAGNVKTIVGNGETNYNGYFVPAPDYHLGAPSFVSRLPSGEIYFPDAANKTLSYRDLNNYVNPLIGYRFEEDPFDGDYSTGTTARIVDIQSIAHTATGSYLFADAGANAVTAFGMVRPEKSGTTYTIPSQDGSEVYIFDLSGKHLRTLYGKTGATKYSFEYDNDNSLKAVVDSFSNRTELIKSGGMLRQIVGPYGQTTAFTSDSNGYLNSMTSPTGEVTQMTYNPSGLMTSFKKPKGNTSTYAYNFAGELFRETNAAGGIQSLLKGAALVTEYVNSTSKAFRITLVTDEDGFEKTTTNATGLQKYETVYSGSISNLDWDQSIHDVTQQYDQRSRGISMYDGYRVITSQNGDFETRKIKRTYQFPTSNYFDFILNETTTDDLGKVTSRKYTSSNKTESVTTPEGLVTKMTIDNFERPVSLQVGALEPVKAEYDVRGRVSKVVQGERETNYVYDTAGRLSQLTDAIGRQFSFGYDASNRLISQMLPDGTVTSYAYDANSNLSGVKPPSKEWHEFIFNILDIVGIYNPPQNTNPNSSTYTYTTDKEILKHDRADGESVIYDYELRTRRLFSISNGDLSQLANFSYDPVNGNVRLIDFDGIRVNYIFDSFKPLYIIYDGPVNASIENSYFDGVNGGAFQVSAQTISGTKVAREYDTDGRLRKIGELEASRNQNGLISSTQLGQLSEIYAYNKFGEIIDKKIYRGSAEIYSETFVRDNISRITEKQIRTQGVSKNFAYSYDLSGRLIETKINGQISKTYSYDAQGNRVGDGLQYDSEDRLIKKGDVSYSYSAHGDLSTRTNNVTGEVSRYKYGVFNNLRSVILDNGKVIDYKSDVAGHRLVKSIDGMVQKKFIYDNDGFLVGELNPDDSLRSIFFYLTQSHSPDGMLKDGVSYKFIKDHLGSIRFVVNANTGAIEQSIEYDEFGVVIQEIGAGFQPFGFAGGVYDSDTKLVRFGVRDYDPEIGRWTTKDPSLFNGGDANLFGYSFQDPVNFVDPSGLAGLFFVSGGAAGASNAPGGKKGSVIEASSGIIVGTTKCPTGIEVGGIVSTGSGTSVAGIAAGAGLSIGYYPGDASSLKGGGTSTTTVVGPVGFSVMKDNSGNIVAISISLVGKGGGFSQFTTVTNTIVQTLGF
jgi:RHS repeat-associated protein